MPENKSLSPRIGSCRNMIILDLTNCSSIPPEILNCTLLSFLNLSSQGNDNDDFRIELPERILLPNLTSFCIGGGGNWNTDEIISWLALCNPNLRRGLYFYDLTKDTANQFMRLLQDNEAFIEKFKDKLSMISFCRCNLNEDDARVIIFNIKPLYPRLAGINLKNNNIEGLERIGKEVRETPPTNNNWLSKIYLEDNPCVSNLNDPESPDSTAMIFLLKYQQSLCNIDSANVTIAYSPFIDYWLIMNRSGLRYLVDDGHGGTRLSGILPVIMNHASDQREQDPTTIFTLLREGPIFRTNEL